MFISASLSLSGVSNFSFHRSFIFLMYVIFTCFCMFVTVKNGMSFYPLSFRKSIDFSILLLLITLWNSLSVYNSCSIDLLRFAVTAYANNDNFTASFSNFIVLIPFSCITKLANSTRTVLNNSNDGGQPCGVFNSNGMLLGFPLLTVRLPWGSACLMSVCFYRALQ